MGDKEANMMSRMGNGRRSMVSAYELLIWKLGMLSLDSSDMDDGVPVIGPAQAVLAISRGRNVNAR